MKGSSKQMVSMSKDICLNNQGSSQSRLAKTILKTRTILHFLQTQGFLGCDRSLINQALALGAGI